MRCYKQKQDLSAYRTACLSAPCPSHKKFNIKEFCWMWSLAWHALAWIIAKRKNSTKVYSADADDTGKVAHTSYFCCLQVRQKLKHLLMLITEDTRSAMALPVHFDWWANEAKHSSYIKQPANSYNLPRSFVFHLKITQRPYMNWNMLV